MHHSGTLHLNVDLNWLAVLLDLEHGIFRSTCSLAQSTSLLARGVYIPRPDRHLLYHLPLSTNNRSFLPFFLIKPFIFSFLSLRSLNLLLATASTQIFQPLLAHSLL